MDSECGLRVPRRLNLRRGTQDSSAAAAPRISVGDTGLVAAFFTLFGAFLCRAGLLLRSSFVGLYFVIASFQICQSLLLVRCVFALRHGLVLCAGIGTLCCLREG